MQVPAEGLCGKVGRTLPSDLQTAAFSVFLHSHSSMHMEGGGIPFSVILLHHVPPHDLVFPALCLTPDSIMLGARAFA